MKHTTLALLPLFLALPICATDLIVNGSFEQGPDLGDRASRTLGAGTTSITGWVVTRAGIARRLGDAFSSSGELLGTRTGLVDGARLVRAWARETDHELAVLAEEAPAWRASLGTDDNAIAPSRDAVTGRAARTQHLLLIGIGVARIVESELAVHGAPWADSADKLAAGGRLEHEANGLARDFLFVPVVLRGESAGSETELNAADEVSKRSPHGAVGLEAVLDRLEEKCRKLRHQLKRV